MIISEKQRAWCIKIINDLYKWNLTSFFRLKIDPEVDGLVNYTEKVKKIMYLDLVRSNLFNGDYTSIDSFLEDLKLVFQNAITYYGASTVYAIMANEILLWISEQEKLINMTEDEIWTKQLIDLQTKLENHIKNKPPMFCPSLIPLK